MGDQRLDGKVAVVTGAGSGMGRASALRFAAEGAAVVFMDADREGVASLVEALTGVPAEVKGIVGDISREADVERLARTALDAFGAVHILLANAGIGSEGSAMDMAIADWNRTVAVNLTGTWLTARAVLPAMVEQRSGSVILTASIAGLVGRPRLAAYSASKGGLVALARQMAVDFGPEGIRVNALCPGTVDTPLLRRTYGERGLFDAAQPELSLERLSEPYPLKRLGRVDDLANAALFLASDESEWVTGTCLVVDGGLTGSRSWRVT